MTRKGGHKVKKNKRMGGRGRGDIRTRRITDRRENQEGRT